MPRGEPLPSRALSSPIAPFPERLPADLGVRETISWEACIYKSRARPKAHPHLPGAGPWVIPEDPWGPPSKGRVPLTWKRPDTLTP